jgi:hypothetical protein
MSYADYLNRFCGAALYRQVQALQAQSPNERRPTSGGTTESGRKTPSER